VWQRVEPLLRPGVNEARNRRLMHEGGDTYLTRRQLVLGKYAKFLEMLLFSPILLSLSPTATQFLCGDRDLADALALGTGPDDPSLTDRIFEAIRDLGLELENRMLKRAALLRSLPPKPVSLRMRQMKRPFPLRHQYTNAPIVICLLLDFTCSHINASKHQSLIRFTLD